MKVRISIKEINSSYSQDYADEYHFGEGSVNNMKFNWSESFLIDNDVDLVSIEKKQTVHYIDEIENIDLILEEVTIVKLSNNGEILTQLAISDNLIQSLNEIIKENIKYYYIYLKDNLEYELLGAHNYVLNTDIVLIK